MKEKAWLGFNLLLPIVACFDMFKYLPTGLKLVLAMFITLYCLESVISFYKNIIFEEHYTYSNQLLKINTELLEMCKKLNTK